MVTNCQQLSPSVSTVGITFEQDAGTSAKPAISARRTAPFLWACCVQPMQPLGQFSTVSAGALPAPRAAHHAPQPNCFPVYLLKGFQTSATWLQSPRGPLRMAAAALPRHRLPPSVGSPFAWILTEYPRGHHSLLLNLDSSPLHGGTMAALRQAAPLSLSLNLSPAVGDQVFNILWSAETWPGET